MGKAVNQNSYSLEELDLKEALRRIYLTAQSLNFPVAFWRMPVTEEISLIVDLSGKSKKVSTDLEELSQGFVTANFTAAEEDVIDFISADLIFSSTTGHLEVNPLFKDSWTTELFFQKLNDDHLSSNSNSTAVPNQLIDDEAEKRDYIRLVEQSVEEIRKGTFKKVVVSRRKTLSLLPEFDIIDSFLRLCKSYPGAFVNFFQYPDQTMWLGATPELLISQDENDVFRTVSLAGTQKAEPDSDPLTIGWTQKEIEEQAMVGRYIIDCFKKIRLREFEEEGPKTVRAANMYHLKSEYRVDTRDVNFPQLATVMLKLLHPTSAVCGTPKQAAMKFILEKESHDRLYYAGFLGPVNFKGGSNLFVNLRCMQIIGTTAVLYAGGGITQHSDPENEWQETEMKCRTLLDIIE